MRESSKIEEELFAAALALPTTEREHYFQRACAGDAELRARVCTLLNAFDAAVHFVKEPAHQFENAGDRIGDYRLLHEMGEGGGGVVYLAEQLTPIKREVALKIIKLGMDTRAVISRFEAERQALALMDHPNIAKVFDAGATATGRPYFVMELVRGIRITDYCNQCRLSVPERLEHDLEAAERSALDALVIYEAATPIVHPDRVAGEMRLAEVLQLQNRTEDAARLFERSLERQTLLFGNSSRQVADALDSLARIRRSQGLLDQAEDLATKAVLSSEAAVGAGHPLTAYFRNSLASMLASRSKYDEAETQVRQALATFAKTLPADHQYVASSEYLLGDVLLATDRMKEAEAVLMASMMRWNRIGAPRWRAARSASALGEVLYRQGRTQEAERHLLDSYRTLAVAERADREARDKARERLTQFYTDSGRRKELDELLLPSDRNDLALRTH